VDAAVLAYEEPRRATNSDPIPIGAPMQPLFAFSGSF
jgi:hypothetical protein